MAIEPATDTANMAGDTSANAGAQDISTHVRDYSGFTRLFKWSAIAAFVIGLLVVFIISD